VDAPTAAILAAAITGVVHLLAQIPSWRRQRQKQAKSDVEIATDLRDELYRHVQTIRTENARLQEEILGAKRRIADLEAELSRLKGGQT
jgi:predicted  nucleic acid-binding Zn-ribbon protein